MPTLARGERAIGHLRAARLLAAESADAKRAAPHLLLSPRRADPWVVEALHRAATLASAQASPATAARYLARALDEPPRKDLVAPLLIALAKAHVMCGQIEHAIRCCEQALDRTGEDRVRAEVEHLRGRALLVLGDHRAAASAFERGLAALGDRSDDDLARQLQAAYVSAASLETSLRGSAIAIAERMRAGAGADPPRASEPCSLSRRCSTVWPATRSRR